MSSKGSISLESDITGLLRRWSGGDRDALGTLLPLVYADLRRLARCYLSREVEGHTLQGTALVHETYLRLVRQAAFDWRDREHFFGIAALTMRRILVEHARRQRASKRGGGALRLGDESASARTHPLVDILLLDRALEDLGIVDPRRARVVEMRFFGGFSEMEIASAMGVSEATVRRDWAIAKAWLYRKIGGTGESPRVPRAGS
jgi:RNA polymerase sigma factor (TIGR02999 family)